MTFHFALGRMRNIFDIDRIKLCSESRAWVILSIPLAVVVVDASKKISTHLPPPFSYFLFSRPKISHRTTQALHITLRLLYVHDIK